MDSVLIHIGLHKTGSSWLQSELFVSDSKIFVPLSKNKSRHSTLAKEFWRDPEGYLLNSFDVNEPIIRKQIESITENIAQRDRIFVMSHERLSGNPQAGGFDSAIIAKRLFRIFPRGKILIMIREQKDWILSNYFQYLSEGGSQNLNKYLNLKYDGIRPGFSPNYLKYHLLISNYQDLFGKDNVLVIPYELFKEDKERFVDRLNTFLNTKINFRHLKTDNFRNKTTNHYWEYHVRFLNYFLRDTSLNNYSNLKSTKLKIVFRKLKSLLNRMNNDNRNRKLMEQLKKEIVIWAEGRFYKSNLLTNQLLEDDLSTYDYL